MTELARMIAARKVSPVEGVQAHLDRIAALDGKLKSYITVMGESALDAARAAEAAVQSGATLGPLHGVPMGLKDLYCTKGVKTTGGSKLLGEGVPAEEARSPWESGAREGTRPCSPASPARAPSPSASSTCTSSPTGPRASTRTT